MCPTFFSDDPIVKLRRESAKKVERAPELCPEWFPSSVVTILPGLTISHEGSEATIECGEKKIVYSPIFAESSEAYPDTSKIIHWLKRVEDYLRKRTQPEWGLIVWTETPYYRFRKLVLAIRLHQYLIKKRAEGDIDLEGEEVFFVTYRIFIEAAYLEGKLDGRPGGELGELLTQLVKQVQPTITFILPGMYKVMHGRVPQTLSVYFSLVDEGNIRNPFYANVECLRFHWGSLEGILSDEKRAILPWIRKMRSYIESRTVSTSLPVSPLERFEKLKFAKPLYDYLIAAFNNNEKMNADTVIRMYQKCNFLLDTASWDGGLRGIFENLLDEIDPSFTAALRAQQTMESDVGYYQSAVYHRY